MRAAFATLLAALAAASAGCAAAGSGGDFEGAEREVAEAIEDLQAAASRQDNAAEVCRDALSRALAQRMSSGGTRCEREIRLAIADADLFDLQVVDVELDGDSATARVRTSAGGRATAATMELVDERGDWRLDAIAPAGG